MTDITVSELKTWMDQKKDFQLIDIREEHEFEAANIGGENIPMDTLLEQPELISKELPVVLYCRSGSRSNVIIRQLEANQGFSNLLNLKGGILAWSKEIDPDISVS
ncbi:MAG TPA: rhodanese-like domain-containing protein [Bacteroidia bacterium]|nr:rhodanese-like domain-containing protein [Bacteroidia bacterium]